MAHPQRPLHGKQQRSGGEGAASAVRPAQRHGSSNLVSDPVLFNLSHQPDQHEQRQQANYHDHGSWVAVANNQTLYKASLDQGEDIPYQSNQREAELAQWQGRWHTETRQGHQHWHNQVQDQGSNSSARQGTPQHMDLHTDSLRQDQLRHQKPASIPFQRSYSQDAAPGVARAQELAGSQCGYAEEKLQDGQISGDDYARRGQLRGKPVVSMRGYNGKIPKKLALDKERIVIEPSSPDAISWDNPFPTFPTNKKKATPADNASTRNMPTQGTQDQRPQTANGERTSNETSQKIESQRQTKTDSPSLQPIKLFKEKTTEGVFKQKTNGNYSLPSSPLAANFSHKAYRTPVSNDRSHEQASVHDITSRTQAYPPNAPWQRDNPGGPSNPAQANTHNIYTAPGFLARDYDKRSYPNGTSAYLSHASQRDPERHDPYDPCTHARQHDSSDVIHPYYKDQATTRQESNWTDLDLRLPLDKDMPDFSVLSIADARGAVRPSKDLHLQPSSSVSSNSAAITSLRIDRGRGVAQEPGQNSAALAQRSRSQPNYQNVSHPTENQARNFDFGTLRNPHNQNQLAERTAHPPMSQSRPSQRAPAGEDGFSARSIPSLPSSHTNLIPNIDLGIQPTRSSYPSPMARPTVQIDQNLTCGTRTPSPHSQSLVNSSEGICAGLVSREFDRTMRPSRRSTDTISSHPIPIRTGLSSQMTRPPPIRQYGDRNPPHNQATSPPTQPFIALQNTKSPSHSLVQADISRLRQAVQANPNEMKAQLALAKKMVEMSSILADQDSRADPKQWAKNREKCIIDAHKMVKKLVNNGHVEAMFYLADCYGRGLLGLEVDPKEAFNLYSSAAKLGHPASAYRVAVCCEMGQDEGGGTRRDPLKAVQWYKRAATLGDTPAMYKIGMIQLKGLLGQPRNPREAIIWLKRAAERADEENPHALHELGLLFESAGKSDNIIRDEAYSLQLFTQAATLGYKFSQHRLGAAYEYGSLGCIIDARQSIAWYSKAAVQEEHQSELALSGWYLTGSEGVLQQSDTEAYLWARKAAHAGLAKAEYAMGYFTEVGIGAPANLEDAKRWYWRAASQNFLKARERLEDLRKGGARMEKSRVSRSAVSKGSDGDCSVM